MVKISAASALLFAGQALAAATPAIELRGLSLNNFITRERQLALAGALANIGPYGSLSTNASRGVVIAAPGILNPDYRYSWTRDSALTMKMIGMEYFLGNQALGVTLGDYLYAEANRQTIYNAMGPLYPWGTGLGEPKYNINLTRYNGVWGRPQRDGPALRAISLMDYCNWLIEHGLTSYATEMVWPIISNDLSYVAQYWNETGYDLWEEVAGSSFFTLNSQWRALVQGHHIAHRLNQTCTGCVEQQPQIACFIRNNYWNATGGYIRSDINGGSYRSGINADSILGAMEIFDIRAGCSPLAYQPCSSYMLSNHKVYVDSFRQIYPINANYSANSPVATGRYPEDSYYGGNPWFITTLAAAEVLYDAAAQFRHQASLTIDSVSLAFFQQFYPNAQMMTYNAPSTEVAGVFGDSATGSQTWGSPADFGDAASNEFTSIIQAMCNYADGFVKIAQQYTPSNGSLSEQYNRTTGEELSAYDLTWSFAAFVTMAERRAGQYPPSWNSRLNTGIAKKCKASSTMGTYAPAIAAGAPEVDESCQIQVTFNVYATTEFGTNIYVLGNQPAIGNWAPSYEPMVPPNYPIWESIVQFPPNTEINYKYAYQVTFANHSGYYALENSNRTFTTPSCGNGMVQIATNDTIDDTIQTSTIGVYGDFCNPDVTHCW